MNKNELITAAAQRSGLSRKDQENALNAAIEVITQALAQGDRVQLSGFGIFELRERAARMGRNPHTGESMEIAAAKTPAFKPSKTLKDAVSK